MMPGIMVYSNNKLIAQQIRVPFTEGVGRDEFKVLDGG